MREFIPFAKPDISGEEIEAVKSVLESGWLTTGNETKSFEKEFTDYLGDQEIFSISVNSATSGLHLALEAIGVTSGDEVITTTHTFTATAEIIRYLGAVPRFIDIDDSFCIDPKLIESKITDKTKAIIPVHFAGLSANMEEILKIAKRHNLKVIEDAAHALPTKYKSKLIGTLESDITVFSFYANKTMTTGEGGMLVTKDPNLAKRAMIMRLHGIDRDAFNRFTSEKPSWYYEVVAPGYKYNLTDIASAIGRVQLKKVEDFQIQRQRIAEIYLNEFRNLSLKLPPLPGEGCSHSWHLFIIQLNQKEQSRDRFINQLFDDGIGCSVHYIPLHLQPYWRDTFSLDINEFQKSQAVYENCISLPIYSSLKDSQLERVINAVKKNL